MVGEENQGGIVEWYWVRREREGCLFDRYLTTWSMFDPGGIKMGYGLGRVGLK